MPRAGSIEERRKKVGRGLGSALLLVYTLKLFLWRGDASEERAKLYWYWREDDVKEKTESY